ncbi:MAG TPA: tripartite tricarboxylate transporter permease [Methylomirabilota bacterium]|nr:tripartite tricarboxylate transporter permease [Methylomirabilota bacterium]
MDALLSLGLGLHVALQPTNLLFCFVGVFVGTLIGVLPGIGPVGTMSLLLPATFHLSPVGAIIMLAGIYYGAQYGGSTTSILVNIPGEASAIVTGLDGYQMARQGRAGPALGMAALGSFAGGTVGIVGLMLLASPLAEAALSFGPPEYFALMCVSLVVLTFLSQASMYKSLMMGLLGLLLSGVGLDMFTSVPRFTLGLNELTDGIGLIPLVMGLFGIAEILGNLDQSMRRRIYETRLGELLPTAADWLAAKWSIVRGTLIGFLLGILPGGGAVLSSFVSYAVEKRVSRYPERFGTGVIEGVAAPETANNAAAQASFIPLLALGIPPNVVMAVLFGGLLIHGITPGPLLIQQHPDLFWGVIASMFVGNVMLLALNLPLIGMWVRLLRVPYDVLFPLILMFCVVGVYSVNHSRMDVYLMAFFGLVGYLMQKLGYAPAPLALAYVLGPLLETALRQSLALSGGSFAIFFTRPIAAACMAVMAALLVVQILSRQRRPT